MSDQFASDTGRGRFGFFSRRLGFLKGRFGLLGWAVFVVVVVLPVLWYGVERKTRPSA